MRLDEPRQKEFYGSNFTLEGPNIGMAQIDYFQKKKKNQNTKKNQTFKNHVGRPSHGWPDPTAHWLDLVV